MLKAEEKPVEAHLLPSRPMTSLRDDEHGPAHILIRRALAHLTERPEASFRFDAPLRLRGRLAHGSDLVNPDALRQLLTWPRPDRAPDLAIVLVDSDGEQARKRDLDQSLADHRHPVEPLIAMSVQEFEAWLIADISKVNRVLDTDIDEAPEPESMDPGEAKESLMQWCRDEADDIDEAKARCDIARILDLESLKRRCPAFDTFLTELDAAVSQLG